MPSRRFDESASTGVRLAQRMAATGSLDPVRQGCPPGGGKPAPHAELLIGWVEKQGDITMPELAAKLKAERGVTVHPASLSSFLLARGYTEKMVLASEAGRAQVGEDRRSWRSHRQPRMRDEPDRLVFLDETATTKKMTRLRERAKRGQRFKATAPFGHGAPRPSSPPCAATGRPVDHQGRDELDALRDLCRNQTRPDPAAGRCHHPRQPIQP